jgi:hypothetical protein
MKPSNVKINVVPGRLDPPSDINPRSSQDSMKMTIDLGGQAMSSPFKSGEDKDHPQTLRLDG